MHEWILRITRLEADFAADGRNAKTVSIVHAPANPAIKDVSIFRRFLFTDAVARGDRPKSQGIQHRNRPRAHGENVAQDPADAGSRALKRLDVTRMIVRFDFERGDQPVADVHHAGVFARPLHHQLTARGQPLQMHFARFVRAVLAPHHGENAKLGNVGIAAENFLNARVLFGGHAVFRGDFRGDFNFRGCRSHQAVAFAAETSDSTSDRKITRPSAEPSANSTARSGCGIRPATLRSRLQMPAMLWSEPLGLPAESFPPSGVVYRKRISPRCSSSASVASSAL